MSHNKQSINSSSSLRSKQVPDKRSLKLLDQSNTAGLSLTLNRVVKLKRFPMIAKIIFRRERPDLVSLLKSMQENADSMPARLKAYLTREKLWDADTSKLTELGDDVVSSGLYGAIERGLYHIWYLDNDPLLGTRPVMLQRDTALFDPKMPCWKKGVDANNSAFRVQQNLNIEVLEESYDGSKSQLNKQSMLLAKLEPEVICSFEKEATVELTWNLSPSDSSVHLKGQLDMLEFRQNKPTNHPELLELSIDEHMDKLSIIMSIIAKEFGGNWNHASCRVVTCLEQIQRYPKAVQNFQVGCCDLSDVRTDVGAFKTIHARSIQIQPESLQDAAAWHQYWLEDFYSKSYKSSSEARQQQATWLNHEVLDNFELPIKENQALLTEISREQQPKSYWHVAAMADLSPAKSRKLRMPISLVNGDTLELPSLISELSGDEDIEQMIYSDRYVHTSRQSRNLAAINASIFGANGLLLTLDSQHGKEAALPSNWQREILQKQCENHGRYWIFIGASKILCWECSSSLDFMRENGDKFLIEGSPTFTPKEKGELPLYLQRCIDKSKLVEEV